MRTYARISPMFWCGETGRALRALGPEAQALALYLLTCPASTSLGLYRIPLPTMAHELGMSIERATEILGRVIATGFAAYDDTTETAWVINAARDQIGDLAPADNQVKGVARMYAELPDCAFLGEFWDRYERALKLHPASRREPKRGNRYQVQRAAQADEEAPSKPLQRRSEAQETRDKRQETRENLVVDRARAERSSVDHTNTKDQTENLHAQTMPDQALPPAQAAELSPEKVHALIAEWGWTMITPKWWPELRAMGSFHSEAVERAKAKTEAKAKAEGKRPTTGLFCHALLNEERRARQCGRAAPAPRQQLMAASAGQDGGPLTIEESKIAVARFLAALE